jgi:diacylglycerol kinase (ATP)
MHFAPQHLTIFHAQIDRQARVRQHSGPVEPFTHTDLPQPDLLLVNPAAGGGRAVSAVPHLKELASRRRWNVDICLTQSPQDLAARASHAAETGRERILVLGGDGTFQALVNAVTNYPQVILGVIPAGGGNDLAAALGLPPDPVLAASLLLEGETEELDVLRVRTSDGNERLYTGGGGVGLDAEAARYANGPYRNLPARFRYLMAAIRALFGFRAIQARVIFCEGEPKTLEAKALLVGALNTPSYGGGFYLSPEAKTNDGKLDLVLLESLNLGEILRLLPALAFSGQLNTHRLRRFNTSAVRIETDPPCRFHGDGEILGMTPVEVTVIPRAIRVLRSARNSKD